MDAPRTLDRKIAVPKLLGDTSDMLIVTGLAGAAKDVAAYTNESANTYSLSGAMGGGVPMGFGLALAQPNRRVLAVAGDGDLMMCIGILATIGIMQPPNFAVLCVDNGHYGETGYQEGHTSRGVDLELIARGSGISIAHTVSTEADIPAAAAVLRASNGPAFVWLRTTTEPPPAYKRNFDAVERKAIFRRALLGHQ